MSDYYVATTGSDSHSCTSASPCESINSVNSRLGGTLPLGTEGTIVHVAPGTYVVTCAGCTAAIVTDKSGVAVARIRYISEQRWAARIVTVGGASSWNNRGSYVDIVGFDISGDGPVGIENNSSSFSRILANNIHNIHLNGTCSPGGGIVMADTTSDEDAEANWVHDVGDRNIGCNQVHGIYVAGPRARVVNNIINRNMAWGIHLWHAASNVVVANNTCSANGKGGIVIGCGDHGCVMDDNTTVNNNIVVDNGGFGMIEEGATGPHNSYNNNLSFRNTSGDFSLQNSLVCNRCVTGDPRMVNSQADGSEGYRLTSTSPARGAGTRASAPSTDFDGGFRPINNAWDIGAYEYGATPAIWPWF